MDNTLDLTLVQQVYLEEQSTEIKNFRTIDTPNKIENVKAVKKPSYLLSDSFLQIMTALNIIMALAILSLVVIFGLKVMGANAISADSEEIYGEVDSDTIQDADTLEATITAAFQTAGYSDVEVTVTEYDDGYGVETTAVKYFQTLTSSVDYTITTADDTDDTENADTTDTTEVTEESDS